MNEKQPVPAHVELAQALSANPAPGNLAAEMIRRGSIDLEFYSPHLVDLQQPHARDELYVIARGSGILEVGEMRIPFVQGDVLFVPAHAPHRFVEFTGDFGAWVLFYGPEGGEAPLAD
jgi:mannose-6-phosphate isomerase-like protein (cupin superfamily)